MLQIHGVPISVHTRKVIVAALAKSIPFEVVPVVPVTPEKLPPGWRELSPTGRIPAITEGDFSLGDSSAICAYLERRHPRPALYPDDARECARVLALEQYAGEALFRGVVHPLFHEVFVHPKVRGIPADPARIDAVLGDALPEVFGYLERAAAGEYLVGSSPSVADIAVASNLVTFQYVGFELPRARYPALAAHFDRMVGWAPMGEAIRRERPVVDAMGLAAGALATNA
jgi:glutathione S-transferase